jgi:hypothetical protein
MWFADHELARSSQSLKQKPFGLRGLAQQDDPLAPEIFGLQARALGLHVATLAMVAAPHHLGLHAETIAHRVARQGRQSGQPSSDSSNSSRISSSFSSL